ncbi:MAG: hydrogenase iron-sulfur subunit [Deltaproteobacteria bacterium]
MNVPALESVFLNSGPLPRRRELRRVLVLGGDATGRAVATRLTQEGFEVLLLGDEPREDLPDSVAVFRDTVLQEVHGFVGGFDAHLSRAAGCSKEQVGFIVAAAPPETFPKFDRYGLNSSERVMSLSEVEAKLAAEAPPVEARGEWLHVAFLCGLDGGSDPATFARVLDAMDGLRSRYRAQPYVFTRQVNVAAWGLERRYRESREEGALYFKFDGTGPVFEEGPEGVVMIFNDPLLGIEMELSPDLLVVDERMRPPASLKPILDLIPSSAATSPFLQPESTRFPGVATAKAGIFSLGPARGNFGPQSVSCDVDATVVAMKTAAQDQIGERLLPGPPEVDPARCTICLTCVRLCPHGAMSFPNRAEADPASCVRCGICAAECPAKAIHLPPPAGELDLDTRIVESTPASGGSKKIVAFLCARSAAHAMETAGSQFGSNLVPLIVPCAGTLDLGHIMKAFQEGAEGVLAVGCHPGNCASIYGTVLASERAARAKILLEEARIDPDRLVFTTLASNTAPDWADTTSCAPFSPIGLRPIRQALQSRWRALREIGGRGLDTGRAG